MATRAGRGFARPAGGLSTQTTTLHLAASAVLQGSGGIVAVVSGGLQAFAVFGGSGFLINSNHIPNTVNASLGAIGQFALGQQQNLRFPLPSGAASVFRGAGSLRVDTQVTAGGFAAFRGSTSMCARATVRKGRRGPATNTVTTGPGATNQKVVFGAKIG